MPKKFLKVILFVFIMLLGIKQIFLGTDPISLIFLAYSLGSIPFGLILTKLFTDQDLRSIGSGNIGTTNVLRTGKKGLAGLTLLLDAGKGTLAVWLFSNVSTGEYLIYFIAASVVIGHLFPIWLDFKGGKGVATSLGVILGLSWLVALLAILAWGITFAAFRLSSLAALTAAALIPACSYVVAGWPLTIFSLFISTLIYVAHKENIRRLIAGKEKKSW